MPERDDFEDPVTPAEIEAALARVLGQMDAGLGGRSRAFLQFIVSESLAGRANRLKAFTIALAVFERDSSFDPQTNSIVRVEATRLRRWLERYYTTVGANDPIIVRIPRGGYAPEFQRRGNVSPAGSAANSEESAEEPPQDAAVVDLALPDAACGEAAPEPLSPSLAETAEHSPLAPRSDPSPPIPEPSASKTAPAAGGAVWMRRRLALAGVSAFAVVCVAAVAFSRLPSAPSLDDLPVGSIAPARPAAATLRPSVRVELEADGGGEDEQRFASALQARIEIALSRFDGLTVIDSGAADRHLPIKIDYRLSGNVMPSGLGQASLFVRLAQTATSTIVWSREFRDVATNPRMERATALVDDLVTQLAQRHGVIFADLRQRALRGDLPAGMSCFTTGSDETSLDTGAATMAAVRCMNQIVVSDPAFAPAYAKLAELRLAEYLRALRPGDETLVEADGAARKAVELAPESSRAELALAEADFFEGKFDDAFRLGRHALDLNPLDTDIMARLGAAFVARDDVEQGAPLLQRAVALNPAYPGWIDFYLFLAAHLRGDAAQARRVIAGSTTTTFALGLAARLIVADESGSAEEGKRDLADLAAKYPDFARRPRAEFDRLALAPAIADRLVDELAHAGLDVTASHP
jgi:tetratricopeptide (TPR) repeat protein